jgi:cell division protein FtsZ
MATIRQYTAAEATVICGAVFDETMEDQLRVTVVATGLGGATLKARKPEMKVVETIGLRNGTDNMPVFETLSSGSVAMDLTGVSSGRGANRTPSGNQANAMSDAGIDKYDIPAFLRRQVD